MGYSIKIIIKHFTRVCARKKIHTKKEIMKDNSKHTIILYLHYLGRQKNLTANKKSYDNKNNLKIVWKTIKGIINMKNKSDESISSLLIDNQLIISAKQISNPFNNFFTSIAEKINRNTVNAKKVIFHILALKTKTQFFFLQQYMRTQKA